jgi:hypothetical protein
MPMVLGRHSRRTSSIWPNRASETVSVSWRAHWLSLNSDDHARALNGGPCVERIRGDLGGLAMTDWPVVGFALLGLACWFGFLYLVL